MENNGTEKSGLVTPTLGLRSDSDSDFVPNGGYLEIRYLTTTRKTIQTMRIKAVPNAMKGQSHRAALAPTT